MAQGFASSQIPFHATEHIQMVCALAFRYKFCLVHGVFIISYSRLSTHLISQSKLFSMAHTRTSGRDPRQGSMFNEIVMLPTFAPDIARPYHVPGTPEYIAAQAALQQELGRVQAVEATPGMSSNF